jgi:hypothetical protein
MRDPEGARFGLLLLSKASKMPVCDEVSALSLVFGAGRFVFAPLWTALNRRAILCNIASRENRAPGLASESLFRAQ